MLRNQESAAQYIKNIVDTMDTDNVVKFHEIVSSAPIPVYLSYTYRYKYNDNLLDTGNLLNDRAYNLKGTLLDIAIDKGCLQIIRYILRYTMKIKYHQWSDCYKYSVHIINDIPESEIYYKIFKEVFVNYKCNALIATNIICHAILKQKSKIIRYLVNNNAPLYPNGYHLSLLVELYNDNKVTNYTQETIDACQYLLSKIDIKKSFNSFGIMFYFVLELQNNKRYSIINEFIKQKIHPNSLLREYIILGLSILNKINQKDFDTLKDCMRYLIHNGADVNGTVLDEGIYPPPLFKVVYITNRNTIYKNFQMIDLLLENGADINMLYDAKYHNLKLHDVESIMHKNKHILLATENLFMLMYLIGKGADRNQIVRIKKRGLRNMLLFMLRLIDKPKKKTIDMEFFRKFTKTEWQKICADSYSDKDIDILRKHASVMGVPLVINKKTKLCLELWNKYIDLVNQKTFHEKYPEVVCEPNIISGVDFDSVPYDEVYYFTELLADGNKTYCFTVDELKGLKNHYETFEHLNATFRNPYNQVNFTQKQIEDINKKISEYDEKQKLLSNPKVTRLPDWKLQSVRKKIDSIDNLQYINYETVFNLTPSQLLTLAKNINRHRNTYKLISIEKLTKLLSKQPVNNIYEDALLYFFSRVTEDNSPIVLLEYNKLIGVADTLDEQDNDDIIGEGVQQDGPIFNPFEEDFEIQQDPNFPLEPE